MTHTSVLYLQLVALSGLSNLFAERTMSRACVRAGVDPEQLTSAELLHALPVIEEALKVYLPPDELQGAMERIRGLAAHRAPIDVADSLATGRRRRRRGRLDASPNASPGRSSRGPRAATELTARSAVAATTERRRARRAASAT